MAQMTMTERTGIEDRLKRGWKIPEIAAYVNKPAQTVTNEIKNRRIDSNKSLKETNSTCRWFGECRRTNVRDTNCGMNKWCKHCHQCFLQCKDYEVRTCERLFTPPFVCNWCKDERICYLPKKYYLAKVDQADRVVGCGSIVPKCRDRRTNLTQSGHSTRSTRSTRPTSKKEGAAHRATPSFTSANPSLLLQAAKILC